MKGAETNRHTHNIDEMEFDYLEAVLVVNRDEEDNMFIYDLGKDVFYKLLAKVKHNTGYKEYKCNQYDMIETRKGTIFRYQMVDDMCIKETKMFDVTPHSIEPHEGFVIVKMSKQKIPNVMFPSTRDYDIQKNIRRFTFRVSNRIFVNFQIEKEASDVFRYKVFVNFNKAQGTDVKDAMQTVHRLMKTLTK